VREVNTRNPGAGPSRTEEAATKKIPVSLLTLAMLVAAGSILVRADEALAPCTAGSPAVAIAWADAGGPIVATSAGENEKGARTIVFLLRNESTQPIQDWCLTLRFTDYLRQAVTPAITPVVTPVVTPAIASEHSKAEICRTPSITPVAGDVAVGVHLPEAIAAGAIASLPVRVTVDREQLPLQGFVVASATANPPAPALCLLSAKALWRPIIVTAPAVSWPVVSVLAAATTVAAIFLTLSLIVLRDHLNAAMGASVWAPGSSLATNVAIIGGVTSSTLASAIIPEYPHIAPKTTFTMLAVAFALGVAIAPAIYNFWCKTTDGTTYQSTVRWFLCCASLTVWGIVGEAGVLLILVAEFGDPANAWWPLRIIVASAILLVAVSGVAYCWRTASYNALLSTAAGETRPAAKADGTFSAALPAQTPPPKWLVL
jgi:hypothetical protein